MARLMTPQSEVVFSQTQFPYCVTMFTTTH